QLILRNSRLTGTLHGAICSLVNLQYLDLSQNSLTLLPPSCMSSLVNLQWLQLSSNRLSFLPPEIVSLPNLAVLDIGNNEITGQLSFAALTKLRYLDAHSNRLIFPNFPNFASNPQLTLVDLSGNQIILRTNIDSLSTLTKLQYLN